MLIVSIMYIWWFCTLVSHKSQYSEYYYEVDDKDDCQNFNACWSSATENVNNQFENIYNKRSGDSEQLRTYKIIWYLDFKQM